MLTVSLSLDWGDAEVLAIEEDPPDPWTVVNASDGGKPSDNGTVRWFTFDQNKTRLSYRVQIPAGHASTANFSGTFRDDTMDSDDPSGVIAGTNEIETSCTPKGEAQVTRFAPSTAACGENVTVRLEVSPPPGNEAWLIDEEPPIPPSSVDERDYGGESNGRAKWVSTDGGPANRTYTIEVPTDASDGSTFFFRGEYRLHPSMSERASIVGDEKMVASCTGGDATGGSGGSTEQTKPAPEEDEEPLDPPETEVDARPQDDPPTGALAGYEATLTSKASEGVRVNLDDDVVSSVDFYPATAVADALLNVVVWSWKDAPDGTPRLPSDVDATHLLELTLEGASGDDHTALLHLNLPEAEVPEDPAQGVLLYSDGGEDFQAVRSLDLTPREGGGYQASVRAPCCSSFAVGYDRVGPQVSLSADESTGGSIALVADASDNAGLRAVQFRVDGDLVSTDDTAPYTATLDPGSFSSGEHQLEATAWDYGGSQATDATVATFGTGGSGGGLVLWALGGLAVLLGGAGVVVYRSRRPGGLSPLIGSVTSHLPWGDASGSATTARDRSGGELDDGLDIEPAQVEEVDPDTEPIEGETGDPAAAEAASTPEDRQAAIDALRDLPGIGEAKAEALYEAGFLRVEDVAEADEEDLTAVEGIGPKLGPSIQEAARGSARPGERNGSGETTGGEASSSGDNGDGRDGREEDLEEAVVDEIRRSSGSE